MGDIGQVERENDTQKGLGPTFLADFTCATPIMAL